jgi:hypothetical protein
LVFVLGLAFALLFFAGPANAQLGNSGSIDGVVKDPSGGVVVGAQVEISSILTHRTWMYGPPCQIVWRSP